MNDPANDPITVRVADSSENAQPPDVRGDQWASWLLARRHGGDRESLAESVGHLGPVRDQVLDNARIHEGAVVLDVGCGDGLVAFGAIDRVGQGGRVIFSDVSQDLLDHCRTLALQHGTADRCQFIQARAEDLSPIPACSVDAVTTRSVLIYVSSSDKARAFAEFFRVLKPGGSLSIFEPINSFGYPEPEDRFRGYDVRPVLPLARRVKAMFAQSYDYQSLVDFDERDLLTCVENSGFTNITMQYEATITDTQPKERTGNTWEAFLHAAPNPLAPTLAETIDRSLTPTEREVFLAHLRQQFDTHDPATRMATVFLRGRRP